MKFLFIVYKLGELFVDLKQLKDCCVWQSIAVCGLHFYASAKDRYEGQGLKWSQRWFHSYNKSQMNSIQI